MRRLQTFFQINSSERRLLLRAAATVAAIRMGLWLLPFATVRDRAQRAAHIPQRIPNEAPRDNAVAQVLPAHSAGEPEAVPPTHRLRPDTVAQIVWAVRAVSRCIPAAMCLTQALAGQRLLAAHGYESRLQIGVANSAPNGFQAHAWLIHEGRIILGGAEADRYAPLAAWDAKSPNSPTSQSSRLSA